MMACASVKQQSGVGLIEVLVTVLILSTSLLALAALQSRSLQFNHEAYLRSQANILAYDIIERIRINRTAFTSYELSYGDDAPSGSSREAADLREWHNSVAGTLPGGEGAIDCVAATAVCTVSLRWVDSEGDNGDGDEPAMTTFNYQTRV